MSLTKFPPLDTNSLAPPIMTSDQQQPTLMPPSSNSSRSHSPHPTDSTSLTTNASPPTLAHLVSSSLTHAAIHERSIAKWNREIEKEMAEYKLFVQQQKLAKAKEEKRRREEMERGMGPGVISAGGGGLASTRGSDAYVSRKNLSIRQKYEHGTGAGGAYASNEPSFLRDDRLQAGGGGGKSSSQNKSRFYPTQLVKIAGGGGHDNIHTNGAQTSRDHHQQRGRRSQAARMNGGGEGVSPPTTRKRPSSAEPKGSPSGSTSNSTALVKSDPNALMTMFVPSASVLSNPPQTAPASTASSSTLLHPLPSSLSSYDLRPSLGLASDEAAAFKSPALYMDLKMRQLFHEEVGMSSSLSTSASQQPALSTSQKVHVIAHLLDTLGQLIEPDSVQAYQTLVEMLKELMIAQEYKNLISVQGGGGGGGANGTNGQQQQYSPSATPSHAQQQQQQRGTTASTKKPQIPHSHHSQSTPKILPVVNPNNNNNNNNNNNQSASHQQLLQQQLASGIFDGNGSMVNGRFMTKVEKQKEKERIENELREMKYFDKNNNQQKGGNGNALTSALIPHPSSNSSPNPLTLSTRDFLLDFDSRKKPLPSVAYDAEVVTTGAAAVAANGGSGSTALISSSSNPPLLSSSTTSTEGKLIPSYRSSTHTHSSIITIPSSTLPNLRQISAAYIEVAWSLKHDVEVLCEKLHLLHQAITTQRTELKKKDEESAYLMKWNMKKNLQLQLYERSEMNISNEIILLKNLLLDLKEEYETLTEETILLEEDYLAHGLVFGGSFAMEEYRYEEEYRNYPVEYARKRKEMEKMMYSIDESKKVLNEIHNERDLLLTRIEVLEQAVNMMHNDEEESDDDEDDDDESGDEDGSDDKDEKDTKAGTDDSKASSSDADHIIPPTSSTTYMLDTTSYPYHQQSLTDLRGRGSTSPIPFLRFLGFYRNLSFTKQDVEVRIKEIWSLKTIADERAKQLGGSKTTLKEYFGEYIEKRFRKEKKQGGDGNQTKKNRTPDTRTPSSTQINGISLITQDDYTSNEFILNFFTTLESNMIDQDFILFLKVILGELNEEHYRDQMRMLANFKHALFRLDLSEHDLLHGDRIDGKISRDKFLTGLHEFFPYKDERMMRELCEILARDCMTEDGMLVDTRKILLGDGSANEMEGGGEGCDGNGASEYDESYSMVENDDGNGNSSTTTSSSIDPTSTSSSPGGGSYSSNFLECMRYQYLVEIEHFVHRIRVDLYALYEVRKIEHARAQAATEENSNSYDAMRHLEKNDNKPPTLTAYDIRHVLRAADLNRSTAELTEFLKRGCNEPYLSKDSEIQIDVFMTNLVESGLVHRTDHWRRLSSQLMNGGSVAGGASDLLPMSQQDREAMLLAEERKAAAEDYNNELQQAFLNGGGARAYFGRRPSMEDEQSFFAARTGGQTNEN